MALRRALKERGRKGGGLVLQRKRLLVAGTVRMESQDSTLEECWGTGAGVSAKVLYSKKMGRHWTFLSKGEEVCFVGSGEQTQGLEYFY